MKRRFKIVGDLMEYTCEICGRKTNNPYIVYIEGARLLICERCAKKHKNAEPLNKQQERINRLNSKRAPSQRRIKNESYEIVENYAELVRNAREKMGLKVEDVAKRLNETESELHKIERGELTPEIKVAKKLEKFFGIKLIYEVKDEELDEDKRKEYSNRGKNVTLGDIVVIKKK